MQLEVYNTSNAKVGTIDVSDVVFGAEVKPYLHHEMVRYQRNKRRAGTHKTKSRGEIRGSTKKLFKQKGTGRARHGSIKAPIFVGGGVVFGPQPRDYSMKMPKSARRAALRSALSQKVAEGNIKVLDAFALDAPKTRVAAEAITKLGSRKALLVDAENNNLRLSVRNLPSSKYVRVEGINVYDLLRYDDLIITTDAVRAIEGVLAK